MDPSLVNSEFDGRKIDYRRRMLQYVFDTFILCHPPHSHSPVCLKSSIDVHDNQCTKVKSRSMIPIGD